MSYPFYQQPNYQNYNPMFQQPLYTPQMSQNTPQRNTDERIWVQGEAGANAYLVAPNGFVRLWDSQQPVFYEKRADSSGRPITEIFTYTKKSEQKPAVEVPATNEVDDRFKAIEQRLFNLERMTNREVTDVKKQSNVKSIIDDAEI